VRQECRTLALRADGESAMAASESFEPNR